MKSIIIVFLLTIINVSPAFGQVVHGKDGTWSWHQGWKENDTMKYSLSFDSSNVHNLKGTVQVVQIASGVATVQIDEEKWWEGNPLFDAHWIADGHAILRVNSFGVRQKGENGQAIVDKPPIPLATAFVPVVPFKSIKFGEDTLLNDGLDGKTQHIWVLKTVSFKLGKTLCAIFCRYEVKDGKKDEDNRMAYAVDLLSGVVHMFIKTTNARMDDGGILKFGWAASDTAPRYNE